MEKTDPHLNENKKEIKALDSNHHSRNFYFVEEGFSLGEI